MEKYELLKERCPSVIRSSAMMFIYRVAGGLLGTACIVLAIVVFVDSSGSQKLLGKITGEEFATNAEAYKAAGYIVAAVLVVLGILFSLVANLAARLMRRNMYIMDANRFIEEELGNKPTTILTHKEVTLTMRETEAMV